MAEAGLPAGVLAVLPTKSAHALTGPLIRDSRLRKISFTGSTRVGKSLLKECADRVVKTSMELGGNAPFIVFDDADLDLAVDAAVATKLRNMGEACNAADHFFAHRSVYDDFTARLADRLACVKVGDGIDEGVEVGPLVSEDQRRTVAGLVESAREEGCRSSLEAPRCRLPVSSTLRLSSRESPRDRGS